MLRAFSVGLALLCPLLSPAQAQTPGQAQAWPSRPVRIVVPSPRSERVQPQKDRQGKRQSSQHEREEPQEEGAGDGKDGESHLDVKA